MKKKTIWSLVLALALVVSAIGTATSALAATSAPMEPVTKIATQQFGKEAGTRQEGTGTC